MGVAPKEAISGSAARPDYGRLAPGSQLGKYEILELLGTGGMAEIYLARAPGPEGFEKLVALKRILPHSASNDEFVRMFLKEARLAATLQHPNIVQVFEVGLSPEGYFFTMEYVRGVDARKLAKETPFEHALAVVLGAAAGLHHAHEHVGSDGKLLGIVHRDVSPSNLLVSYEGSVKVTDFGVAKAVSEGKETRTGAIRGKISYLSPEQCRGQRIDRRSDVFALGIVLYALTTGTRLFQEASEFETMSRIVSGDIPAPTAIRRDYPEDLEAIVLRSLRIDPDERFQTAQALQLALEAYVREHRIVVSSVSLGAHVRALVPEESVVRRSRVLAVTSTASVTDAFSPTLTPSLPIAAAPSRPRLSKRVYVFGAALALALGAGGALAMNAARRARPPVAVAGSLSEWQASAWRVPEPASADDVPPEPIDTAAPAPAEAVIPTPPATSSRSIRQGRAAAPRRSTASAAAPEPSRPEPRTEPAPPSEKPPAPAPRAATTAAKPKWDLDSWYAP